jgi:ABC-type Fe3+ transport system substrate-binding protein
MKSRFLAFIIATIVASGLSPVLSSTAQAIDLAALYKAAKSEGKVVVYTAPRPKYYKYALKAFKKKYPGIAVEMITGGGSKLQERFLSEEIGGISVADVWNGGITSVSNIVDTHHGAKPILQRINDLPSFGKSWLKDDKEGLWSTFNGHTHVSVGYNTKLVRPDEVPTSWNDLLNPKWKNELTIRVISSGSLLTFWISTFGSEEKAVEYIKKLHKQNITFYSSSTKARTPIVMGEKKITIRAAINHIERDKAKGRPIDWVLFKGAGLEVMPQPLIVSKNAPHSNAAKLWTEYMLSKEGQALFIKGGLYMPGNSEVDVGVIPSEKARNLYRNALDGKIEYKSSVKSYEKLTTLPKKEKKRLGRVAAQLSRK